MYLIVSYLFCFHVDFFFQYSYIYNILCYRQNIGVCCFTQKLSYTDSEFWYLLITEFSWEPIVNFLKYEPILIIVGWLIWFVLNRSVPSCRYRLNICIISSAERWHNQTSLLRCAHAVDNIAAGSTNKLILRLVFPRTTPRMDLRISKAERVSELVIFLSEICDGRYKENMTVNSD